MRHEPPSPPRSIPAAVVFDCDGILLDTDRCWVQAERTLFDEARKGFGPAERAALLGRGLDDAGRVLELLLGRPGQAIRLVQQLGSLAEHLIMSAPRLMPGARALATVLRAETPLGVASNTSRATVVAALGKTPLADTFVVVVGADCVLEPKPAPDVYLEVCARLAVTPDQAVAIEDSPVGVQAARAAGMHVIGVPSVAGVRLDADFVTDSLEAPALWQHLGLSPCPA